MGIYAKMEQTNNNSAFLQRKLEALVGVNDFMMDRLEQDVQEFQLAFARGGDWKVKQLQLLKRLEAYSRLVRDFQA